MPHTFTNLLTHIIFSTRERRPSIDADLKPELLSYMGGIVRELGGSALTVNGTQDHVHLLVILPASVCVAEAMRVVKTNSSRWVHEQWLSRRAFGWQTGYGAFSVSKSHAPEIIRYIATQEEHHRKVSFKEESIAYLKKHEIDYDERYIWE
jgi:putative transposase